MCQKMLRLQLATSSRWRSQVRSAIARENRLFYSRGCGSGSGSEGLTRRKWPRVPDLYVQVGVWYVWAAALGWKDSEREDISGVPWGRVGRLTNSPNY